MSILRFSILMFISKNLLFIGLVFKYMRKIIFQINLIMTKDGYFVFF